jgi:hypothetical protein
MSDARRNPYRAKGSAAKPTKSLVAFLDILGFRNDMVSAYKKGPDAAASLLTRLRAALDRAHTHLHDDLSGTGQTKHDSWYVKAFTDNVVIGMPICEDSESDLGLMFSLTAAFQRELVSSGFFVRGAVAVGEAYMDDEIVFGDAVLRAYEGEKALARDPRIILTESAMDVIRLHLDYYGKTEDSPYNDQVLLDADGQAFINYMEVVIEGRGRKPIRGNFRRHKEMVETQLQRFNSQPGIWSKYAWVAAYHDFLVGDLRLGKSLLVDPKVLSLKPLRLAKVIQSRPVDGAVTFAKVLRLLGGEPRVPRS